MTETSGTTEGRSDDAVVPPEIDVSRAHPARSYDYFLGGKDNFAADRAVAEKVLASWEDPFRSDRPGHPRFSPSRSL